MKPFIRTEPAVEVPPSLQRTAEANQVLDDIRVVLIEAGDCIASGRIKEGKDLVDQLVAILSKGAA
jgi:hypothetical protein